MGLLELWWSHWQSVDDVTDQVHSPCVMWSADCWLLAVCIAYIDSPSGWANGLMACGDTELPPRPLSCFFPGMVTDVRVSTPGQPADVYHALRADPVQRHQRDATLLRSDHHRRDGSSHSEVRRLPHCRVGLHCSLSPENGQINCSWPTAPKRVMGGITKAAGGAVVGSDSNLIALWWKPFPETAHPVCLICHV